MTQSNLAEQGEAVSLYLDSLLKEGPEDDLAVTTAESTPAPSETISDPAAGAVQEPAPAPEPQTASSPVSLTLPDQPDALIPDWANAPFQAMLFKVGELSLALPMQEMIGVVEWNEIKPEADSAGVQLGFCQHNGLPVPVVDTARLVLPASMVGDLAGDKPSARVTRVVIIEDGRLGLACDSVHEIITLKPEDIRWHTARTRRQWLAGTSVELMCALLDTGGLVKLLTDAI